LPGATFEIIAAEDIYDVFGKLIIKNGTIVDTITTDKDGRAESKVLRLGRYEIVEIKSPAGFVQSDEKHAVTLDFGGRRRISSYCSQLVGATAQERWEKWGNCPRGNKCGVNFSAKIASGAWSKGCAPLASGGVNLK
jgi:hypothetical protein